MQSAAAEEEAQILRAAREEAEERLVAARAASASARRRHCAEAEATLRAERARLESEARLRITAERAAAREALVRSAFEAVEQALAGARALDVYPRALEALLAEALRQFPAGERLVVRCDRRDTAWLSDRGLVLDPSLGGWGGCVVQQPSGAVVADNTLERRFERARETLWVEVATLLAGGASAAPTAGPPPPRPRQRPPAALGAARPRLEDAPPVRRGRQGPAPGRPSCQAAGLASR